MPICCCKDCENVYGVRPGLDDTIMGHRRSGFPAYDYADSEDDISDPLPPRRHREPGRRWLSREQTHTLKQAGSADSSEPPHQDLLNLVAAAEQIERNGGSEKGRGDEDHTPHWQPTANAPEKGGDIHAGEPALIACRTNTTLSTHTLC
jgi:hypothetical protein